MKKIQIFLILISSAFIVSCESNTYTDICNCYKSNLYANIGPIVKSNCTGCHSGMHNTQI